MKVRRGFELVSYDLSPLSMQCALDLLFHQMAEDENAPKRNIFDKSVPDREAHRDGPKK